MFFSRRSPAGLAMSDMLDDEYDQPDSYKKRAEFVNPLESLFMSRRDANDYF